MTKLLKVLELVESALVFNPDFLIRNQIVNFWYYRAVFGSTVDIRADGQEVLWNRGWRLKKEWFRGRNQGNLARRARPGRQQGRFCEIARVQKLRRSV